MSLPGRGRGKRTEGKAVTQAWSEMTPSGDRARSLNLKRCRRPPGGGARRSILGRGDSLEDPWGGLGGRLFCNRQLAGQRRLDHKENEVLG